jgi:hypothetical protein
LFADKPTYHALSYTWGNPSEGSEEILVNGKPVRIVVKVCKALHALRYEPSLLEPGKERCLWIDGLCINQTDDEERNQQVMKMRDIYSHAEEVVIWLGDRADNSQLAMRFMEKISQRSFSDEK